MRNGLAFVLIASIALAPDAATAASPYAGWQGREVKSLSERQLEDYLKGNGMGLALPAELNHYPGPRHVLALAEDLALTAAQRTVVTALEARMSEEAIALGKTVIAREADLDALFAQGRASEEAVEVLTMRIGGLKGRLRATHLKYHLLVRALLTPHQIAAYDRLRGYAGGAQGGHMGHGGAGRR